MYLLNVHINGLLSKYETYDVFGKMLFKVCVDLNFKFNLTVVQTYIEKKCNASRKFENCYRYIAVALRWKLIKIIRIIDINIIYNLLIYYRYYY